MLVLCFIIILSVLVVSRLMVIIKFIKTLVYMNFNKPIEVNPEPIPYYIDDEINAIYELIEINQKTIDEYNILLGITFKESEQLKIRKKVADLQLKNAKLENKVNKLLDKYGG